MSLWPWVLGGGAVAYAFTRRSSHPSSSKPQPVAPFAGPLPGRWVWPVPRWNGRAPVISDGFNSPRPGLPRHGGVDLMFLRQPADPFKAGTPNGSKWHVMPDGLSVLAASDGVIWSAMNTSHGYAVVIDHAPRKVATFYTHMEKLFVPETAPGKKGAAVRAGQPLGVIGASPLDAEHLKHLHFEVWLGGPNDRIDPSVVMHAWETLTDPNAVVARNAGLVYRRVGAPGEAYPDWVRALKDKAGVYLIRDAETAELLYVGSSASRLYDTLTRHFQVVRHEAQEVPMT